jgi:hypothetical protein
MTFRDKFKSQKNPNAVGQLVFPLNLIPFVENGGDSDTSSSISTSKKSYQKANFQFNSLIILSSTSPTGNPPTFLDLSEDMNRLEKTENELAVVFHRFSPALVVGNEFSSIPSSLSPTPASDKFLKDHYQEIRDSIFWGNEAPSLSSPKMLRLARDFQKSEQKSKFKIPFRARFRVSGEKKLVVFLTEDCGYTLKGMFENSFSKPLLDLARILAGEVFPATV